VTSTLPGALPRQRHRQQLVAGQCRDASFANKHETPCPLQGTAFFSFISSLEKEPDKGMNGTNLQPRWFPTGTPALRLHCEGLAHPASTEHRVLRLPSKCAPAKGAAGTCASGKATIPHHFVPRCSAREADIITESQNHRMFRVGRDLCGSSSPTPLPKQGHLQ